MYKIIIYNNAKNRMETYYRELSDQMPYSTNRYVTVKEFRGSSNSNILWTTSDTMQAFNKFRARWGRGIHIGYAFKRIWEGGHGKQSQHYAGTAMDCAQNLTPSVRKELYQLAIKTGLWGYVEPFTMTPTWLHIDRRYGSPACSAGYPILRNGSVGVYVLVLQDALTALGFSTGGIDGYFGNNTLNAVLRFQRYYGISQTGNVACQTWTKLVNLVVGIGPTNYTINYF